MGRLRDMPRSRFFHRKCFNAGGKDVLQISTVDTAESGRRHSVKCHEISSPVSNNLLAVYRPVMLHRVYHKSANTNDVDRVVALQDSKEHIEGRSLKQLPPSAQYGHFCICTGRTLYSREQVKLVWERTRMAEANLTQVQHSA